MGIRTVVAHSTADADSRPCAWPTSPICIGPPEARQSYLNIPSIISAAAITDSEAIHPGYGLLSENSTFAEVCRACGITFIGPSPEAIRLMGDKAQARGDGQGRRARRWSRAARGRSTAWTRRRRLADDDRVSRSWSRRRRAAAAAGCASCASAKRWPAPTRRARRRRGAAFGSSELYLEKFVEEARHVEVQVLGDRNGMRVHLGERDCSIQRRHQKLLEESPAPRISPATRAGLRKSALAVAERGQLRLGGHGGVPRRPGAAASTSSR